MSQDKTAQQVPFAHLAVSAQLETAVDINLTRRRTVPQSYPNMHTLSQQAEAVQARYLTKMHSMQFLVAYTTRIKTVSRVLAHPTTNLITAQQA